MIHPDDLPLVTASIEQVLATDQPVDMEARYRRADGSWRYLLSRRVAERDASGEPIAFVGVALDVTERVEHLRHAEELARRLDAASRAAGVGIWTTTADPESTDWNAQMFELFDRYEPPHAPPFRQWLHETVHPDDRDRVRDQARAYFGSGDGLPRSSCASCARTAACAGSSCGRTSTASMRGRAASSASPWT